MLEHRWARFSALAAATGIAGACAVAVSAPASAAVPNPCSHPGWSEESSARGHFVGNDIRIRSGPYLNCLANGTGDAKDDVRVYCFRNTSDGRWTFLKDFTTGVRGWTADYLLDYDVVLGCP